MIQPGAKIGMIGGGQLGRMSILAGRRLGYRFEVFEPKPGGAASMVADAEHTASYEDVDALRAFAGSVDVATLEFENIPLEAYDIISSIVPVHPGRKVLEVCQNRLKEKAFLTDNGILCAKHKRVESADELATALAELGAPAILKTVAFGYDGKGQIKISQDDAKMPETVWSDFGAGLGILEQWVDFQGECSVVCARTESGRVSTFPVAENIHTNQILDFSIVPARFPPEVASEAENIAKEVAAELNVVGLIAVEFFVDRDNRLLVNEMAPRPHNSGHYSFSACATSQFEQHIRAVCDLPLGSPRLLSPVVMVNILGDAWRRGEPDWASLLEDTALKLDLYDKGEAKPGRKMGHFCVLDEGRDTALTKARAAKEALLRVTE